MHPWVWFNPVVRVRQLRRDWSNHELGEPYNLSNYYGYYLAEPKMYTPQEKLAVFDR